MGGKPTCSKLLSEQLTFFLGKGAGRYDIDWLFGTSIIIQQTKLSYLLYTLLLIDETCHWLIFIWKSVWRLQFMILFVPVDKLMPQNAVSRWSPFGPTESLWRNWRGPVNGTVRGMRASVSNSGQAKLGSWYMSFPELKYVYAAVSG